MRALITGASGGIGYELAKLMAADKNDLVLVARSEGKLKELAGELSAKYGISVQVISKDLSQPGSSQEVFEQLKSTRIDYLVNNAGYGLFGNFWETDPKKELEMIELNVVSLTQLTKLFLPQMIERKQGRILNVASTAAFQPGPLMAVYYATKSYVLHFSEALAEELEGTGVTVTTLCPGPTETGFQKQAEMQGSRLIKRKIADSASVARVGYAAMLRGKRVVIPGLRNKLMAQSVRFSPRALVPKMVKWMQARD
jgi:uncharacterized protein